MLKTVKLFDKCVKVFNKSVNIDVKSFKHSFPQFCEMIKHKGEIVEQKVRQSGYKIGTLAKKIGMTRENLYDIFKRADVNILYLTKIGKAIDYDFSIDFPKEFNEIVSEPEGIYHVSNVHQIKRLEAELKVYKEKYFQLLEEHKLILSHSFKEYFEKIEFSS